MEAAVKAVEDAEGAVGALVNNAGYSQSGAVESVTIDDVRAPVRDQRVRPDPHVPARAARHARARAAGRIVNVGSMGGKLTFPGGGIYHATKYAVEALSDAMRFEVKGFGVDVVLIEPGLITTEFATRRCARSNSGTADDGPYAEFNQAVARGHAGAYEGPTAKLGGGPETVAKAIEKAITSRRPRTRYPVTPSARADHGPARAAHRPHVGPLRGHAVSPAGVGCRWPSRDGEAGIDDAAHGPADLDRRVVPRPGARRARTCTSAGVMVFEGPAPSREEFAASLEERLHLVPRYRQKLSFPRFEMGRPLWVDDPSFNIGYHVRHTALPGSGQRGAAAAAGGRGSSPSASTAPSRCGSCGSWRASRGTSS